MPDDLPPPVPPRTGPGHEPPRIVRSEELLQGRRELWIQHGNDLYRLRITARGNLYLTK